MTIREAGLGDVESLSTLHRMAFEAAWDAPALATFLAMPGAYAFVAMSDHAPIGFILCRAAGGEGEILTLATAPGSRRQGVARALLTTAMETARMRGAEAVFLEVARDNVAALGLYQGAGFQRVGVRRGYYRREGGEADALVLRRALNRQAC